MTEITDTGAPTPQEPQPGFWHGVLDTLRYPARRDTLLFLGAAAVCLAFKPLSDGLLGPALSQSLRAPLLAVAGVAGLAALVLLPEFFSAIVKRSAAGEQYSPGWPGLSDSAALMGTALKVYAVVIWSLLPLLIYRLSLEKAATTPSVPLVAALGAISFLYLPMALLLLIMSGKLWPCLLPSNVIDPVVRTFSSYWRVWLLMLAVTLFLPGSYLLARIPLVGPTLATFGGLYLFSCAMYALGRFCRLEQKKLNWL
ncbi:MAG: hypothetical protein QME74_04820 [Candidatus Edwardsbacteria bacterium]|nr:hypothetical protein [Candidatus Edwardsbacteria bacterium]